MINMKSFYWILSLFILISCKEHYNRPEVDVKKMIEKMVGKYELTLHITEYDAGGKVSRDTIIPNITQIELIAPTDDDPFPKLRFANILAKYSAIIQHFNVVIMPLPPDYSGSSEIFWDPDNYEKRINLWGIGPMVDYHIIVNREITSKKEERWWIMRGGSEGENRNAYLEEWDLKKLK